MADFKTQNFSSIEVHPLFAGTEVSYLTTSGTVAAGQGVLLRGAVLGKVTSGDEYKLVDGTATDGSEVALVVLSEEVDTTDGAVEAIFYKRGVFRYQSLYVADGDDVANHQQELEDVSIYFKTDY